MPFSRNEQSQLGIIERTVLSLAGIIESDTKVDIITFVESPKYLNKKLYPRQRLLLKLYYRLPLESSPCWCTQNPLPQGYPSQCPFCQGTGVYDELIDIRRLLTRQNKYAKCMWPGLTPDNAALLSDEELRAKLLVHAAFILEVVAGRRGSKSVLGAFVAVYELYGFLREPDPHSRWGIIRQEIGVANAATDEEQAKILYGQMLTMVEESPWFRRHPYRALETKLDFVGRKVYAKSLHSNSASIRGQALKSINIDEYWHFNKTSGKMSDKALWAGLTPSLLTFHQEARVVLTSSPVNRAGQMWEIYDGVDKGTFHNALIFQLATWEMNPNYPRYCDFIIAQYALDKDYAEVEYGAQIAESIGYFIPWDAIDACVNKSNPRLLKPIPGVDYHLHIDLSKKKDRTGLHLCHYDKDTGSVVTDLVHQWDPKDSAYGEISHEEIYQYIVELHKFYRFRLKTVTFDQFNSAGLIQRLRSHFGDLEGKRVFEVTDNDKHNRESYSALRSVIAQGMYRCYEHPEYKAQLKALSKTMKDSGQWKVEAPPGEHDDLTDAAATAVLMCLNHAQVVRSGIHVVETDGLDRSGLTKAGDELGAGHLPSCTLQWCDMGCPAQAALYAELIPQMN